MLGSALTNPSDVTPYNSALTALSHESTDGDNANSTMVTMTNTVKPEIFTCCVFHEFHDLSKFAKIMILYMVGTGRGLWVGLGGGLNEPAGSCLQTLIFE